MTNTLIKELKARSLNGPGLNQTEIVTLLNLNPASDDCLEVRRIAHEAAREISGNKAYIWGAVGVDFAPCAMNCDFCSFGADWRLVKKPYVLSEVEILAHVRYFANNNVHYIVLRTTEFFSTEILEKLVRKIKSEIPGTYELVLNIGDFDPTSAQKLYTAGVDGVYHALRLREGSHTRFNPLKRLETLNAVRKSPLKLIHLVEPIGPEHADSELADIFLNTMDYDVAIGGAMARIPVKGTPLGREPIVSNERLAQIIAVLRLAGGRQVPDICVHPPSDVAVASGANVVVVETGAIPRDRYFSNREWQHFDVDAAKAMLQKAGYAIAG